MAQVGEFSHVGAEFATTKGKRRCYHFRLQFFSRVVWIPSVRRYGAMRLLRATLWAISISMGQGVAIFYVGAIGRDQLGA